MAIMRPLFVSALLAFASAAEMTGPEAYGLADSDVLETVDVTGDGGILKLVLQRGAGEVAKAGQTVNAHYDGKARTRVPDARVTQARVPPARARTAQRWAFKLHPPRRPPVSPQAAD
jgi:hypothetical protein